MVVPDIELSSSDVRLDMVQTMLELEKERGRHIASTLANLATALLTATLVSTAAVLYSNKASVNINEPATNVFLVFSVCCVAIAVSVYWASGKALEKGYLR